MRVLLARFPSISTTKVNLDTSFFVDKSGPATFAQDVSHTLASITTSPTGCGNLTVNDEAKFQVRPLYLQVRDAVLERGVTLGQGTTVTCEFPTDQAVQRDAAE